MYEDEECQCSWRNRCQKIFYETKITTEFKKTLQTSVLILAIDQTISGSKINKYLFLKIPNVLKEEKKICVLIQNKICEIISAVYIYTYCIPHVLF